MKSKELLATVYIKGGLRSLLFFVVCALSGCIGSKYPLLPSTLQDSQSLSSYNYVIGPGDTLDIFVWGYQDLTTTLPVRPDGKITTRLVEDMQASGKTPTELARDIELKYANYVKGPVVSISVNGFIGSPSQQIKVVGGGSEPRIVPYSNGMTLLDLLIVVGGLGEYANGNKSVLIRTSNEQRKNFSVRLDDLIRDGDISANAELAPGDVLIIPESWY